MIYLLSLAVGAIFYGLTKVIARAISKNPILSAKIGFWVGWILAILTTPFGLGTSEPAQTRAEVLTNMMNLSPMEWLAVLLTIVITAFALRMLFKRDTNLSWPWSK